MGLKMENVNIYGDSPIFRGGGSQKNNIYGELPKKGSLDNFHGAWQKIGRIVFLRGIDTSMHTMT